MAINMSGLEDATFVIDLDTTQLVAGSQKAKQTFQEMASSGTQSMQTVQTQTDQVSNSVTKFGNTIEKTRGSISSMIGPVTGLAASSASLYFSFDQLERASVRVEQGHLRVEKAQATVNKLQQDGKQNTDEYARAMQNLQIQQERYDLSQNQVNENMVFMSLSMVTLASSTIPSVIKAVQALKITQEEFAVVLEATMPWLLAITAGVLAWEEVIAPLIKQHYNLDLGIQSNIEKMVTQHNQIQTNIGDYNEIPGTLGVVDNSLATTSGSFDALGNSITTTTEKLTDMMQAFKEIQTGGIFSDKGVSLFGQNDQFTQSMKQIDQIHSIEGDIQKLMENHYDKQTAINMVMDHYMTLLQEEAFQHGESNDQLQKKIDLLRSATTEATKLLDVSKQQSVEDQKKAKLAIATDLAKQLGLSPQLVMDSFDNNVGSAYNSKLHDLYMLGQRDFGQTNFLPSQLGQNLGMFGARPFIEGVGYGGISNSGINTSTAGLMHNDNEWNRLVESVANQHMFGTGLFTLVKDSNREAVENGEANAEARSEQSSSDWQKFYALKQAGLFNGDPALSLEDNLANAVKQYDSIFSPLRSDVATKLEALHTTTWQYLTGDSRRGMSYVTNYSFSLPSQDELKRAIADSRFASEKDFQDKLKEAENKLNLSENAIVDSLSNQLTVNDIQAELTFKDRLAAMSSGA